MIASLLPNHGKSIQKEMTAAVEERIFEFDLKAWLKTMYQNALDTEFEQFIGFGRYERNEKQKTFRNGFYER